MIPALVALLSAPGLYVAWRLLRPLPLRARDAALVLDDDPDAQFGFDYLGLVD